MPTNIEIKARSKNFSHQKSIAESTSDTPCEVIEQEDVFFNVSKGRLKLRIFSPQNAELIFYERENISGPKESNYQIAKTTEPRSLQQTLASALGVPGVVRKKRHLYLVGQTRIHLDEVEELGQFIELEVVMKADQSKEDGIAIAKNLMKQLDIAEEDLIDKAYIDMLIAKGK